MGLDPRDLGFQQGDPFVQFVLGIGRKVFGRQFACGIAPWARKVDVFHLSASSQSLVLAVNGPHV